MQYSLYADSGKVRADEGAASSSSSSSSSSAASAAGRKAGEENEEAAVSGSHGGDDDGDGGGGGAKGKRGRRSHEDAEGLGSRDKALRREGSSKGTSRGKVSAAGEVEGVGEEEAVDDPWDSVLATTTPARKGSRSLAEASLAEAEAAADEAATLAPHADDLAPADELPAGTLKIEPSSASYRAALSVMAKFAKDLDGQAADVRKKLQPYLIKHLPAQFASYAQDLNWVVSVLKVMQDENKIVMYADMIMAV
jgi:hypothetical protein